MVVGRYAIIYGICAADRQYIRKGRDRIDHLARLADFRERKFPNNAGGVTAGNSLRDCPCGGFNIERRTVIEIRETMDSYRAE